MYSKPKVQLHKQKLKKKCLHKHKTNRKSSSEKLPTALPRGGGGGGLIHTAFFSGAKTAKPETTSERLLESLDGINFDKKKKNTSLMRARILYFLSFSSRETELHERITLAIIHFCC